MTPRAGRPWRRLQAQVRREEPDCWLCGQPIDLALPRRPPHPYSSSIDHVIPVRDGGPNVRSNLRHAHARCNASRGARPPTPQVHSRHW